MTLWLLKSCYDCCVVSQPKVCRLNNDPLREDACLPSLPGIARVTHGNTQRSSSVISQVLLGYQTTTYQDWM